MHLDRMLCVFSFIFFNPLPVQELDSEGPALRRAVETPIPSTRSDFAIYNSSIAIADLNQDGFSDIVFVSCEGLDCGSGGNLLNGRKDLRQSHTRERSSLNDGTQGSPLFVHALDGSRYYQAELPGIWPREIGGYDIHPTVAIGDVNFNGKLDVVVGGLLDDGRSVFAFQPDGRDVPGWEFVYSEFPPFFNAPAIADVNLDGAIDSILADESTYLHRFNSLGRLRQCQFVEDPVYSSPAVGDVGRLSSRVADGMPDEVAVAEPGAVKAYLSFGKNLNCDSEVDRMLDFSEARSYIYSSPAVGDLDLDGTQDIAITRDNGANGELQVMCSSQGLSSYVVSDLTGSSSVFLSAYSSPAIVDLDGDGKKLEILFGTENGILIALRYDKNQPSGSRLRRVWSQDGVHVDGSPISSSPIAVNLLGDARPEIVVATEAGKIHVLDPDGNTLQVYSCLNGLPYDEDAAFISTPAVWRLRAGDSPMIVGGNRRGLFVIQIAAYPSFDPAKAQWPTFHANNARTGCLPFAVVPTRGSVGGLAHHCFKSMQVALLDSSGEMVNDYYGGPAVTTPTQDHRFLFEMLTPGNYIVRFLSDPVVDIPVNVAAGRMRFVEADCPLKEKNPH